MPPKPVTIYEAHVLDALYVISPTGVKGLTNYLELKHGTFDVDSLNEALKRLISRGSIISHTISGITMWGLPGTWT